MLREKNIELSPLKKRFPLQYDQVKKIIQNYRKENNLNSEMSFDDPSLQRTIEGSIFRRCRNQYNTIYKSIFPYSQSNFIDKFIINEYILYCSPAQEKLLRLAY